MTPAQPVSRRRFLRTSASKLPTRLSDIRTPFQRGGGGDSAGALRSRRYGFHSLADRPAWMPWIFS